MELLTRQQVIDQWQQRYGIDIRPGLRLRVREHHGNTLAPEPVSYYISFRNERGERKRYGYWPNTMGLMPLVPTPRQHDAGQGQRQTTPKKGNIMSGTFFIAKYDKARNKWTLQTKYGGKFTCHGVPDHENGGLWSAICAYLSYTGATQHPLSHYRTGELLSEHQWAVYYVGPRDNH